MINGLIAFISTISLLIFSILLWCFLFGPEQYYIFDPYCDTVMAPDFVPEKLSQIKTGMDVKHVENILGKPLTVDSTYHSGKEFNYYYTHDGKLLHADIPWYMCRDYAWYSVKITFDSTFTVKKTHEFWAYD